MLRVDYINTIYFKTLTSRHVISNEYDLYLHYIKHLSSINTMIYYFPSNFIIYVVMIISRFIL